MKKIAEDNGDAPNVEAALTMSPSQAQESLATRRPTIGQRKPVEKKGVSSIQTNGSVLVITASHYFYCFRLI